MHKNIPAVYPGHAIERSTISQNANLYGAVNPL
jgi:hypothetical protein